MSTGNPPNLPTVVARDPPKEFPPQIQKSSNLYFGFVPHHLLSSVFDHIDAHTIDILDGLEDHLRSKSLPLDEIQATLNKLYEQHKKIKGPDTDEKLPINRKADVELAVRESSKATNKHLRNHFQHSVDNLIILCQSAIDKHFSEMEKNILKLFQIVPEYEKHFTMARNLHGTSNRDIGLEDIEISDSSTTSTVLITPTSSNHQELDTLIQQKEAMKQSLQAVSDVIDSKLVAFNNLEIEMRNRWEPITTVFQNFCLKHNFDPDDFSIRLSEMSNTVSDITHQLELTGQSIDSATRK